MGKIRKIAILGLTCLLVAGAAVHNFGTAVTEDQLKAFDPTGYLAKRKFPALKAYRQLPSHTGNYGGPSFDVRLRYLEKYQAYLNELNALSDDELEKRCDEEKQ